jgi:hypothetical protein
VPGVANIYPYTGMPGEVDVYVEATTDQHPDGIPSPRLLADVLESMQFDADGTARRAPATVRSINVKPIARRAYSVVIHNLADVEHAHVEDEIASGIDEHLRSLEPYIVGLSVLPRRDRVTQGAIGGVVSEIVQAAGGTVDSVQLRIDSAVIPADTLGKGEKAKLDVAGVSYVVDQPLAEV